MPLIEEGVAGETVVVAGSMEEVMSRNLAFVVVYAAVLVRFTAASGMP
jgi:hypothetical protein